MRRSNERPDEASPDELSVGGLRIVQIIATLEAAGGPTYTVPRLAMALAKIGHDVELMTVGGGTIDPSSPVRHRAFPKTWANAPGLRLLWRSTQMKAALAKDAAAIDVIHSHSLWVMPGIYGAQTARAAKIPYVVSPRGTMNPAALGVSALRKQVFWRLVQGGVLRRANCIHVTSEQEYLDCRRAGLKQPITVIPNGVDIPLLPPPAQRKNVRRLLYLGRIHPIKGLVNLVTAWSKLEEGFPDWELRIVGPDELSHTAKLQNLSAKLGLQRVSFAGAQYGDDKLREFAAADLYVLPSFTENFGMSAAEALAQGVPVVTTTDTPWAGLVANNCGWWIPANADALADALGAAMGLGRDALGEMGRNGRAWIERDFSWTPIARKMQAVYRWLIDGGTAPDTVRLD